MTVQGAGAIRNTTATLPQPVQTDPRAEAARILATTQIGSGPNAAHRIDFIEAALDRIADRAFAAAVRAEVVKGLSTTEQGQLAAMAPSVIRDAGNGQTVRFSTTSTKTQDQWIAEARAGNYRDLAIYTQLAGANDNASIKRAMDDVYFGRITPSQFVEAGAAVDAAGGSVDMVALGLDLTQMTLDVVGIFDQSGISDGANALISAGRGDWIGAGLSVLAAVPVFGALATAGKLGKWAETIAKAIEAAASSPAARAALEPALRRIHDALKSAPDAVLRALPDNIRQTIDGIRTKLDDFFRAGARQADEVPSYRATLRGQEIVLDGVRATPVNYVKRDRVSYDALRRAFDNGARADFVRSLTSTPEQVAALRRAGLDDVAIARLADGRIPQGWQVHHKLPLDDGGTNAFENLVLIRNDPYHLALTNAQRDLVGDLPVGGSRQVDFPIPDGSIYPALP